MQDLPKFLSNYGVWHLKRNSEGFSSLNGEHNPHETPTRVPIARTGLKVGEPEILLEHVNSEDYPGSPGKVSWPKPLLMSPRADSGLVVLIKPWGNSLRSTSQSECSVSQCRHMKVLLRQLVLVWPVGLLPRHPRCHLGAPLKADWNLLVSNLKISKFYYFWNVNNASDRD